MPEQGIPGFKRKRGYRIRHEEWNRLNENMYGQTQASITHANTQYSDGMPMQAVTPEILMKRFSPKDYIGVSGTIQLASGGQKTLLEDVEAYETFWWPGGDGLSPGYQDEPDVDGSLHNDLFAGGGQFVRANERVTSLYDKVAGRFHVVAPQVSRVVETCKDENGDYPDKSECPLVYPFCIKDISYNPESGNDDDLIVNNTEGLPPPPHGRVRQLADKDQWSYIPEETAIIVVFDMGKWWTFSPCDPCGDDANCLCVVEDITFNDTDCILTVTKREHCFPVKFCSDKNPNECDDECVDE